MSRSIATRCLAVLALVGILLIPAAPAMAAYNPFDHAKIGCSGASDSAVCKTTTSDPLTGPNGVLPKVTLLIAIVAGAVSIIVMALAGFRYITSGGDAEQIAKAKKTIILAAVGLLVIALGQAIISVVLGRI